MSVRFDGKNYSYLSYVMRNFFKGKKMCGDMSVEPMWYLRILRKGMLL
jgi:hypothetical protein